MVVLEVDQRGESLVSEAIVGGWKEKFWRSSISITGYRRHNGLDFVSRLALA